MPEQMITIAAAKRYDDSGKISIRDHQGRYWTAGKFCNDPLQLLAMTDQAVIADLSHSDYNGKTYHWLNKWRPADGRQPLQQQAPQQPVSPPQTPSVHVPPPPPKDDRQNSIIAQTLCKTVSFNSVQEALAGYQWLLEALSGEVVIDAAAAARQAQQEGPDPATHAGEPAFDDDIPW